MFDFLRINKNIPESEPVSHVGCFGKLPIYDEYIRYNMNKRSVLELDEWIQQGYAHHSRGFQTRHQSMELHDYVYHFVFTGSGYHHCSVLGAMMGSHDKCGRQFPFVIFKLLPNQNTKDLTSTFPCAYRSFLDKALTLCSTDWSLQPITILMKRVDALNTAGVIFSRRQLLESEMSALQAIKKDEFWRDMLGDSAQGHAPRYVEVMKELMEIVVRKSPLSTSWGIEIPLPGNDHCHEHVSFWVHAAECLLGARGWRPHYIWGDGKNQDRQTLYLFFRPVSPIFFSHLLGNRVDNGILISLEQESTVQRQVSHVAERIGELDAGEHMVNAFNEWSNWSSL
jgi:type VI secretion system ImpM family protein